MKTLHIVPDEKFIDGVINSFDALGEESRFLMFVRQEKQLVFIRQKDKIEQIVVESEQYQYLTRTDWPDLIWIHFLDDTNANFISDYAGRAKIVWSAWGGDYHNLLHKPILSPRTLWALFKLNVHAVGHWLALRRALGSLRRATFYYLGLVRNHLPATMANALKKISFFSTVIPEEEPLIRMLVGQTPTKIDFVYSDPNNRNRKTSYACCFASRPTDENGVNVWVGNSAFLTNNTFDVIHQLAKADRVNKVYAPLSYGDRASAVLIDQYGRKTFGDRWTPIYEFMDRDAYFQTMSTCLVFAFGHIRQQAVGNVCAALLSGGCVFMHPLSPLYAHLKKHGFTIYCLKDISKLHVVLADFAAHRKSNMALAQTRFEQMDPVKTLRKTMRQLADCCTGFSPLIESSP